jgi:hypothetical protein
VFTGRVVGPGEPEFLREDTDGAIALAEEERDTCPSCGMPKAWCRDGANQFAFDPEDSVCWPTYRLAQHRNSDKFKGYDDATQVAVQVSARFRDGREPDVVAGLDLGDVEVD